MWVDKRGSCQYFLLQTGFLSSNHEGIALLQKFPEVISALRFPQNPRKEKYKWPESNPDQKADNFYVGHLRSSYRCRYHTRLYQNKIPSIPISFVIEYSHLGKDNLMLVRWHWRCPNAQGMLPTLLFSVYVGRENVGL